MKTVALTGGTGSGKSAISAMLSEKGLYVIDCDRIGHEDILRGNAAYDELVSYFSEKILDENGEIVEVHCTYDPESRGGNSPDGRKVKGTLHWVNCEGAVAATARLYDYMMLDNPDDPNGEMIMNPNSLEVKQAWIEPSVLDALKGERFQFMRNGYYIVDVKDTSKDHMVFNRIVPLKSSFKIAK